MEHISQHLTVTSQGLQTQDLKPSVIGEENGLAVALAEPRIKDGSLEDLKAALRLCMVMVGVRQGNEPKGEEKAILLRFIIEQYGGHTCSEIKLAFEMAITGKLGLKEVSCYENFSVLYFATIMNAYRKWSREAVWHVQKETKIPEKPKWQIELDFIAYELRKINQLPYKLKLTSLIMLSPV